MRQNGFTTTILHSDRHQSVEHGAVHKPMHPSSEFAYEDARELAAVFQGKAGFTYARQGTPTTTALEAKITQMEGGKGSVSFSTGMAALSAIFTTLLRRGDHLVSSQYVFGNTNSLLGTLLELGVEISFVDATDSAQVREAIRPNTRMVFTETIANPGTQVADLAVIGEICRERGLVYVVDNTLTSPWMFRPSSVGASLVMNSLSKYIGGHGNALGGAVTDTGLYDWSGYGNIYEAYRKGPATGWGLTQIKKKGLRDMGGTLAAEPAHRIAVGAETLALRMAKHCSNALALARFLESHRGVAKVHYPGLESHPQHARARAVRLALRRPAGRGAGRWRGLLRFPESPAHRADGHAPGRHAQPGAARRPHHLLRNGRRAAPADGHRRQPDPRLGGHRGRGRPAV